MSLFPYFVTSPSLFWSVSVCLVCVLCLDLSGLCAVSRSVWSVCCVSICLVCVLCLGLSGLCAVSRSVWSVCCVSICLVCVLCLDLSGLCAVSRSVWSVCCVSIYLVCVLCLDLSGLCAVSRSVWSVWQFRFREGADDIVAIISSARCVIRSRVGCGEPAKIKRTWGGNRSRKSLRNNLSKSVPTLPDSPRSVSNSDRSSVGLRSPKSVWCRRRSKWLSSLILYNFISAFKLW